MKVRVALALVLVSSSALAQGSPRSTPLGGRSVLMGGAAVALGSDGAAPFVNPASIVRIDDGSLAFSVNLWKWQQTRVRDWYRPATPDPRLGAVPPSDATLRDSSFDALPSTLCLFLPGFGGLPLRAGRQKLAACFGTIESDDFTFTAETYSASAGAAPRVLQSVQRGWKRLELAPTYSVQLTDEIAAGASLIGMLGTHRGVYASALSTLDPSGRFAATSFYSASRGTSVDVAALVGATYHAGPQTLGLSFQLPSAHLGGTGSVHDVRAVTGSDDVTSVRDAYGDFAAPSPARVALGAGTEWSAGALELDVFYTFARTAASLDYAGVERSATGSAGSEQPLVVRRSEAGRGVVGVSAGVEAYPVRTLSVLAGANADLGAVPSGALGDVLGPFHPAMVRRVGGSFGFGTHGEAGQLLFGTEVSYGWGQTLAVDAFQIPPRLGVADMQSVRVVLVLAGTTSLRALRRAVDDVIAPSATR